MELYRGETCILSTLASILVKMLLVIPTAITKKMTQKSLVKEIKELK